MELKTYISGSAERKKTHSEKLPSTSDQYRSQCNSGAVQRNAQVTELQFPVGRETIDVMYIVCWEKKMSIIQI